MKKKTYILCIVMSLCLRVEAQNAGRLISASVKFGILFPKYETTQSADYLKYYNNWNTELSIEDNKFGWGVIVRYISSKNGVIKNPLFTNSEYIPYPNILVPTPFGKLVGKYQNYSNYSFLVNKKLFLIKNKHRFDVAIGFQLRDATLYYFNHHFGWETYLDEVRLDKYGLISRLGYTYMIHKHIGLTTNVEYSKFKKDPSVFFDFNVLVGVRF